MAARLVGSRSRRPRMSPAFRHRLFVRQEPTRWLDRRSALLAGLGVATGMLGTSLVAGIGRRATESRPIVPPTTASSGHETTSRDSIEPSQQLGRWVDTGLRLAAMAEGTPYRVSAGAIGAFVVRRGDQVVGMSSVCSHLPCELAWMPDEKLLICPCHGRTFDVEGQSVPRDGLLLPALPFVMTRVRGDGGIEVLGT